MAFLTYNNGTLPNLPTTAGVSAPVAVALPPVTPVWGVFSSGRANPWWGSKINAVVASWLDNLYIYREAPRGVLGDLDRSAFPTTRVAYGNVLDDLADTLLLLNTYRVSVTSSSETRQGSLDGVTVTPAGGLTLLPGGSVSLAVTLDASAALSTIRLLACQSWTSGASAAVPPDWGLVSRKFCVLYLGARARLFAHLPDWGSKPPTLRWAYPADIFESDGLEEQRVTALTAPDLSSPTDTDCVHFLSAVFKEDGRLSSTSLWSALYSIAHRRLALPFYFEALYAAVDAVDAADVQIVNFNLSDLLYESGEILRIDKRSGAFETRVVQVVDRGSNIITVDASWEASIPPTSAAFYFVLYAVLDAPPSRKWLSDLEQHVTLKFRSVK